jgi:hypothetical protein
VRLRRRVRAERVPSFLQSCAPGCEREQPAFSPKRRCILLCIVSKRLGSPYRTDANNTCLVVNDANGFTVSSVYLNANRDGAPST